MGAVVRVLWGDDRQGCRWHKTVTEVVRMAARNETCPQHVYVYGQNNVQFMRNHLPHVPVTMADPHPFPDGEADHMEDGHMRIPWHYKHELISQAVRDHGPVIYCDWDVNVLCDNPAEPLEMLKDKEFALTAFYYKRSRPFAMRCCARASHINVTGAIIYTRNIAFPSAVLNKMRAMEQHWHWHDEMAMNDLIDEMNDGWPGEIEWLRKYENPVVGLGDKRSPWGASWGDCVAGEKYTWMRRKTPAPFEWVQMFRHY